VATWETAMAATWEAMVATWETAMVATGATTE